ncbi:RNA-guided endonuclease TnpB family protein [cf. Phormidesmis sp. LEGE 11477]|uniref:RNA-guided endonuclease InsQ/TnpB family protein n=1 Tax=cf. Phormidesmis sp. LEGE 11477 TaxID=1828680 RepID=UPI001882E96D|nr:RNA-guided endonuclease TnpB family protein [cf. Phormidesmis sp. LEGE 11477]MBE9064479.1 transposase [cf. Phormidesmis sp. LEGE 11477]
MKARYTYRIYPNRLQQNKLAQVFGCVRVVYNDALATVKATPKGEKWPSNAELQKRVITQAKQTSAREWLSSVSVVPLQQSVQDLGFAFKHWFAALKGNGRERFPRFKKRSNAQSARFTQRGFSLSNGKLILAKMGAFKVRWSRELPSAPSSVTIVKNTAGQYHASFVVEVEQKSVEPMRPSIGIDLGIKVFAFPSVGKPIKAPDYSQLDRKVRRLQKRMARQQKGSNRREATRLKLAKLQLKIRNIRKNFLHTQSTKLVRENQTVSLEDLNVSGMVKNRKLSRAISQQGWREFRTMLESKAAQYVNRTVNIISRWEPTSQTCSGCGFRWGKLDLSVRSVLCINCGAEHDRDQNAAENINIVGAGLAHDSKRTQRARQTSLLAVPVEALSHKVEQQLSLFA